MRIMNKETLIALRESAEQRWNELQEELKKLQGEYRILTKLIDEWVEVKVKERKNAKNSTSGQ